MKNYTSQLAYAVKQIAVQQNRYEELTAYADVLEKSVANGTLMVTPLYGSLAVGFNCNSHCSYCDIWHRPAVSTSLAELKQSADALCNLGVFIIGLTGGEPALFKDLPHLISYIRKRQVFVQVLTNGLLLKRKCLIPALEADLSAVVLSLDTIDPVRYFRLRGMQLEPILRSLDYLLDCRIHNQDICIAINCVISKVNLHDLAPLVRWCSDRNISIGFQPLHKNFGSGNLNDDLAFSKADLPDLENAIETLLVMKQQGYLINNHDHYLEAIPTFLVDKRLPAGFVCKAGFTTIVIDPEQKVKTCWSMHSVGDLHHEDIHTIWQSTHFQQQRVKMTQLDCPRCWIRAHTELIVEDWMITRK